ncbi:hypothetical protein [Streptomyces sp. NPDC087270]|uniref:hypothetical protein n=1 Tax=Streptomyces sp. NPDC087270 TaxID=3365774 RepID=UPI00381A53F0
MSSRIWRRWAATLAAMAVTLFGGALTTGSAHADDGSAPTLSARTPVGLAVPDDGEGQVSWGLDSKGSTLHDVRVTVDITGISSFATTTDDYCVNGLCTFPGGDVGPHGTGGIVDISAKPDAKLGASGTAVINATASGVTIAPFTVKVSVGSVDLAVNSLPQIDHVKPGTTLTKPLTVANIGSLTAATTDYRFAISPGLSFATHFPNCDYADAAGKWEATVATCHFSTPIEPGKKYRLSTPLKLDVKKSALYEIFTYVPTVTSSSVPTTPKSTSAGDLTLVPDGNAQPGDPDQQGRQGRQSIYAANTADIALTGDTATAKPGDTATLTATATNLGPASVNRYTYDDQLTVMVDIPKGTTATQVPAGCVPWDNGTRDPALGAPQYTCDLDGIFDSGHTQKLTFKVKVDADAPATTSGTVVAQLADLGTPPYDTHLDNNKAAFTVKVPGGASTGTGTGTGSTGGSGSTGGGNQNSTQTGTTSGTSGGSGSTGGDAPAATGSLAHTGSDGTMTIALTSAAALALGGAVFALARSRRTRVRARA